MRGTRAEPKAPRVSKPTKHPAKFVCEECGKSFTRGNILKSHLGSVHKSVKPYACNNSVCNRAFARLNDLKRHKETVHREGISARLICGGQVVTSAATWGCRKSFATLDSLFVHLLDGKGQRCMESLEDRQTVTEYLRVALGRTFSKDTAPLVPRVLREAYPEFYIDQGDSPSSSMDVGQISSNDTSPDSSQDASKSVSTGRSVGDGVEGARDDRSGLSPSPLPKTKSYWIGAKQVALDFYQGERGAAELASFRQLTDYLHVCDEAGVNEHNPDSVLAYFDRKIEECESEDLSTLLPGATV